MKEEGHSDNFPGPIEEMENVPAPPFPQPRPEDPRPAEPKAALESLETLAPAKTIAAAAAAYSGSCNGGDTYANNCAHYLSDAFLRAGFDDLLPPNNCINARCGTQSKRPIRARDMWCWFKKKATKTATSLPQNDGFWAVFQLDESQYWGGHVLIYDSDNNEYYGTGHYPDWDQHCYKW